MPGCDTQAMLNQIEVEVGDDGYSGGPSGRNLRDLTCPAKLPTNHRSAGLLPLRLIRSQGGVQLKVAGIPHRESQALVTTIRQAGGFAAVSRWLSASDTTGL